MDFIQTIVLSLVQGLSEFLPISSSAHLILVPKLTDWPDQGLAFDVVVHMGTLSAVVFYYRAILKILIHDFFYSVIKVQTIGQSSLAWGVLLGTIPVGLAGLLFKDFIEVNLRSTEIIAYATLVFGVLLGFSSWVNTRGNYTRESLNNNPANPTGIVPSKTPQANVDCPMVIVNSKIHFYKNQKCQLNDDSLTLNGVELELISILLDGDKPDYELIDEELQF